MRKLIQIAALGVLSTIALVGCDKQQEAEKPAAPVAVEVKMPTDATDKAAWKAYLVDVVKRNMAGVTSGRPYMYFVPAGEDQAAQDERIAQTTQVSGVVARTVLPGNMLAFGGPDSKLTGDLILDSFKDAKAGAFKDVIVLFIGSPADQQRVQDAVAPSGATFRFVEMK
ncbi:hypothetical protein [Tahibacter amnicola]|uniref:Lipoprotein n=1 Tax=Tahibacter amnicola TaxID=2976241 RepID=A0ABY6BC93_9GAMM|nr:hypothetical protein [Tahibacter amnicola]UXI67484.1 hypothetical protein N4264_22540 [Tahibacter amnicola]